MSERCERWADDACLRVNCASEASSISASGASLADVRVDVCVESQPYSIVHVKISEMRR